MLIKVNVSSFSLIKGVRERGGLQLEKWCIAETKKGKMLQVDVVSSCTELAVLLNTG